jgi:PadR family transcriptional regulator PadR
LDVRILGMAMYQNDEIDNKITQLRKGILELAILSALYRKAHYGYSLVRDMAAAGVLDLKEGTIYPILSRLAKEKLVHSEWVESNQGPPRKYYSLTHSGRAMCEALNEEFRRLVRLVDAVATESASIPQSQPGKRIIIGRQDNE